MLIQRDKWIQYGILGSETSLAKHLPATQLLTQNTLKNMLLQYSNVVLKPRNGSYGRDIVFIQRNRSNGYRIQNEDSTIHMKNIDQLLQWIQSTDKADGYIVQERLRLAQIQHKPFDIRIMVQRQKGTSSPWNATGSYAKVASQGYLVTNVTSCTISVLRALQLARIGDSGVMNKIEKIARIAAKCLGEHYPDLRQVGFDIGIDRNRRVWIIEGNYKPDLRPFRRLRDSSMYRRILWYKEH
ncbi:YheC/YheD family protein [Paenibacillus tundrae]|uniref:YheC/YheD family protein n=1 Tax=Paenibacillus tundrae TaxID=528187 RepID=UPI0030CB7FDB